MSELVTTSQKFSQIREVLEKRQGDIAKAIPRGIDAQRFTRVALSNFQIKPQLLDCTPASVFTAIMQAAAWGLELDPVLGHAYLVPYKQQCQLLLGYRGMLALARRSGDIANFIPGVVHQKDTFTYKRVGLRGNGMLGTILDHLEYDGPDDPGPVVATYIVMITKDGSEQIDVMFRRDIDKVRSRSRAKDSGPWVTDFEPMALKSVVRRASKFWPLETSVAAAINQDELIDLGIETPVMPALEAGEPEPAVPAQKSLNALIDKPRVAPEATPVEMPAAKVEEPAAEVKPAAEEVKPVADRPMTPAEYNERMAFLQQQIRDIILHQAKPPEPAEVPLPEKDATNEDLDREIAAHEKRLEEERRAAVTAEEQARARSKRDQASAHEMPRAHREAAKKPAQPEPAAQPSMIEREPGQEG